MEVGALDVPFWGFLKFYFIFIYLFAVLGIASVSKACTELHPFSVFFFFWGGVSSKVAELKHASYFSL